MSNDGVPYSCEKECGSFIWAGLGRFTRFTVEKKEKTEQVLLQFGERESGQKESQADVCIEIPLSVQKKLVIISVLEGKDTSGGREPCFFIVYPFILLKYLPCVVNNFITFSEKKHFLKL